MRLLLPCAVFLFFISCKTRETPVTPAEESEANLFSYSLDTLDSLNEYIPLLTHRKLRVEHYCYTIISHVNVVDVSTGTISTDRTVVLHDNFIEAILATGALLPDIDKQYRVLRINGTGKYLAPGLCDMHVHYECSNAMRLQFLMHGVTSVRNVDGSQLHLDEQQLIATQQLLGPNCYSAFRTNKIPRINDTSFHWRNRPPTWLYMNGAVDMKKAQSDFVTAGNNEVRVSIDTWHPLPAMDYPDHTAFEQWTSIDLLQRQTNFQTFWFFSKFYSDSARAILSGSGPAMDVLKSVPSQFCVGTETQRGSVWDVCPVVNEMKFLAAHGVSNITVLQIATRNAGIFTNTGVATKYITPVLFGEIKEGYRADLLLLRNNPLADVGNYAAPETVFINGVCLNANDLSELKKATIKLK
jgi:hypothetical protein